MYKSSSNFLTFLSIFVSSYCYRFYKVLANHGLTEYIDDALIRNTSRELSTALKVSPVALNAAADVLLQHEIKVTITKYQIQFDAQFTRSHCLITLNKYVVYHDVFLILELRYIWTEYCPTSKENETCLSYNAAKAELRRYT